MREVSTALETAKATTRVEVYRSSRDPRQRPRTGATALPLPRVGILPVQNVPRNSTSKLNDLANAHSLPRDIEKRKESNEEANREDQRCYSPSQAISDEAVSSGPSPPSVIASPDQSPSNFDMVEKRTQSSMSAVVTLDNDGDVLSIKNESPASPPPDKNVYIAPTPKIISECDTRPSCEQQPLHITSHTYQAPEISLFANMRGSAINNFQLSNAGLQKLNEMGVRWGASAPASKPIGPTSDSSEATSSPFTKNERSADGMTAVAQRKISKGGNDKSCNMSRFASVKEKSCETRQPAADKAYERQTDRPSRWETDRSSTCAPTDIDYRTILPQLASASTKTSPHGNAESIIARSMTAGISISAGDRDDRTILTTVAGVSAHVAQPIPSDLKPPRLLEAVPPPVSPNLSSNQSIRGLDIVGQAPHAVMENLREIDRGPGGHSSGSVPLTIIQGSDETARGLSGHIFTSLPPRISPKLKVNEATRGFGGNLLRPVPPPAISNEMDGGPGGHPIISGPVKGIPTCKPIPLNSIRPRQPGLLGERPKPPCFLTSVCISAGGARAPLAVPPPRLDTTRPPPANSIQRSPFENMVPGGYGFFNRPTLPTTPHCASSSSYSSTLDSVVAVDFPNGLRQKGFIVPDGKLFVQALMDTSDPISNTSKRYSQYNHILNEFIPRGCIELLKSHECDDAVNAALACDYLECVARIARDNGTDTKIIFLSGVNPNAEMSQKFEKVGVEVCNFQQLMEKCGL
ncbi:hypothetical protein Tcan_04907 [Toxocara canis]|uniref:TASOR PIN domain-containing protein n=1 Tax=Toxocara canis TaxID=6265 RepID=A0A0B2VHS9_TOXCA|nr:hypothetical protein Tcan_04907 [Toxocara canis]